MIALAIALSYAGWTALCFAMPPHARKLLHHALPRAAAMALRIAGCAALVASLFVCARLWGWPTGSTAWFGILSASGFALIGLLAVSARLALLAGLALPVAALFAVW